MAICDKQIEKITHLAVNQRISIRKSKIEPAGSFLENLG
jgi:hypothetical protein